MDSLQVKHIKHRYEPIGESRIAMSILTRDFSSLPVDNTLGSVPVQGNRQVKAKCVLAIERVYSRGLDGDNVAGPAESITVANEVFYGNSFITCSQSDLQFVDKI